MKTPPRVFRVYCLKRGTCGFYVSAMDDERKKAAMLEHLIYSHSEAASD